MTIFNKWKDFLDPILEKGGFEKSTSVFKNTTESLIYKTNSFTEIHIGFLEKDLLIYLKIFNPSVPGYNEYIKGEHFYKQDFSKNGESHGDPALEFNERNKKGVLSILESGLKGKEIQFVKDNKILKSKLYISESHSDFGYSYYFTKRSMWNKLFRKKIEKIDGIEKREIELNKIFNGIQNVSQQRI